MLNAVDTLWKSFKTRMQTINPNRQVVAYMNSMDWPPKVIVFEAFYLLDLADSPLGKPSDSWSVPFYEQQLQFQWIIKGTDTSTYTGQMGRNRGDRFRINKEMEEELLQGLYPGFAQKQQASVDASQKVKFTTLNEPIVWTKPQFRVRGDRESGLVYGIGTVRLTDMTQQIDCTAAV